MPCMVFLSLLSVLSYLIVHIYRNNRIVYTLPSLINIGFIFSFSFVITYILIIYIHPYLYILAPLLSLFIADLLLVDTVSMYGGSGPNNGLDQAGPTHYLADRASEGKLPPSTSNSPQPEASQPSSPPASNSPPASLPAASIPPHDPNFLPPMMPAIGTSTLESVPAEFAKGHHPECKPEEFENIVKKIESNRGKPFSSFFNDKYQRLIISRYLHDFSGNVPYDISRSMDSFIKKINKNGVGD